MAGDSTFCGVRPPGRILTPQELGVASPKLGLLEPGHARDAVPRRRGDVRSAVVRAFRVAGCPIAGKLSGTQPECMRAGRPRSRVGASSHHSCSSISSWRRRTWEMSGFSVRRRWGLAPGGAVTGEFRRFDSVRRCQCGCEGGGCHCGYQRRSTGSIRPRERPGR